MKRSTQIVIAVLALVVIGAAIVASRSPMPTNLLPSFSQPSPLTASSTSSDLPVLADAMPPFGGITKWYNTANDQPLTPESLKGKVVLVDFWTYSCINCIRTYPFLKSMHDKYADKGLVIVGVHTPEFAFEADPNNVGREIEKNGLKYPVALDATYQTWNAYNNQYWPAEYFFDRQGRLRHVHFGEGEYDQSEEAIRALLAENGEMLEPMGTAVPTQDFSDIQTNETYFGLNRGNAFMGGPQDANKDTDFTLASTVAPNQWSLGGTWRFTPEHIESRAADATFRFNIQANETHLVMDATDGKDKHVDVYVDGKKVGSIIVNASTLYTVAKTKDGKRHVIELRIHEAGVRLYAATFS